MASTASLTLPVARDHHHGGRGVTALELAQDVDARPVRELEVEEHRGRATFREEAQALAHRGGGLGAVASRLQHLDAALPYTVVVVDDEDGDG